MSEQSTCRKLGRICPTGELYFGVLTVPHGMNHGERPLKILEVRNDGREVLVN